MLADDLPDAGQHANRVLAVGPDGKLYLSVGSTCNECNESNPENATLLQMNPDGKSRRIFASGLRNTIGFDWNPRDGKLWGMDQGMDWLGDDDQPEELNRIEQGKRYGWPYIYAAPAAAERPDVRRLGPDEPAHGHGLHRPCRRDAAEVRRRLGVPCGRAEGRFRHLPRLLEPFRALGL